MRWTDALVLSRFSKPGGYLEHSKAYVTMPLLVVLGQIIRNYLHLVRLKLIYGQKANT